MSDFQANREISINAPPETVFGIISDFARHKELAGLGELVNVRKLTEGPVGLGSMIEASESVHMGDQVIELSTTSVVVGCNPPNIFSWIVVPPFSLRRVQWWFQLTQQGAGTKLVHETEVDLGEAAEQFGGVETFKAGRGADIATGMQKTLENVKQAAEK